MKQKQKRYNTMGSAPAFAIIECGDKVKIQVRANLARRLMEDSGDAALCGPEINGDMTSEDGVHLRELAPSIPKTKKVGNKLKHPPRYVWVTQRFFDYFRAWSLGRAKGKAQDHRDNQDGQYYRASKEARAAKKDNKPEHEVQRLADKAEKLKEKSDAAFGTNVGVHLANLGFGG
jgi:hypothetical protein